MCSQKCSAECAAPPHGLQSWDLCVLVANIVDWVYCFLFFFFLSLNVNEIMNCVFFHVKLMFLTSKLPLL